MEGNMLRQAAENHKSDILQPFDTFMDLNGFDSICAFCDYFGGTTVYIPRMRTVFQRCLELEVIKEFNGVNYQALVRKYGLSLSHVRKVIHNARKNA